MSEFEKWFVDQDFYTNMRFIHGDALFTKDGDVYRVLPVQMTHLAWVEKQSEIDQLKAEKVGLEKLIKEWRKSANWMCATDDKHVINSLRSCADDLEKVLRGEHE